MLGFAKKNCNSLSCLDEFNTPSRSKVNGTRLKMNPSLKELVTSQTPSLPSLSFPNQSSSTFSTPKNSQIQKPPIHPLTITPLSKASTIDKPNRFFRELKPSITRHLLKPILNKHIETTADKSTGVAEVLIGTSVGSST